MYQIGSFHHCVLLFNNHLLPPSRRYGRLEWLSATRPKDLPLEKTDWLPGPIIPHESCHLPLALARIWRFPVSLYISNQNFSRMPRHVLQRLIGLSWPTSTLWVLFITNGFASKNIFSLFCHRRSAFRMVSTFLTDDILFIKVGMLSLGVFAFVFAGQPRNRWEMGQVLPSCLRNVARMEWFTSQTIDVVALLWGSSFCSWNLLRVVTYAQMRPTL